jgi:hypothetical protein
MEENKEKIQKELKKNEEKVKNYAQALNDLNKGELNTSKTINETDEEYLERLQEMASVPFLDRNSEMKALMREKERLRDNIKLLIRDDANISQFINYIYLNEPLLMYEINKFFPGFQEYFIKKYGVNNDKINFKDIINESAFYLKRSTDPRVLSGNVPLSENKKIIKSEVKKKKDSGSDSESELEEYFFGENPMEGEAEGSPMAEPLLLKEPIYEGIEFTRYLEPGEEYTEPTILGFENKKEGRKLFLKWRDIGFKVDKDNKVLDNDNGPIFFYSLTGKPNSYKNIHFQKLVSMLISIFSQDKSKVADFLRVPKLANLTKQKLAEAFEKFRISSEIKKPKFFKRQAGINTVGYGVKQSQDLPDKVPFGSNILFLKKLFLKNILSIQNKHNTKINGFNNVHVSDNFVKIIMNLLKGINFTNSELQNLTNNEKLLLDNLLILSELNKKFVTGSSTSSLNQLKKDYEILIGEIEAGNNNDLLKKKLYNLLMRMVHFGALSQIQALKHYKEILKSHF